MQNTSVTAKQANTSREPVHVDPKPLIYQMHGHIHTLHAHAHIARTHPLTHAHTHTHAGMSDCAQFYLESLAAATRGHLHSSSWSACDVVPERFIKVTDLTEQIHPGWMSPCSRTHTIEYFVVKSASLMKNKNFESVCRGLLLSAKGRICIIAAPCWSLHSIFIVLCNYNLYN